MPGLDAEEKFAHLKKELLFHSRRMHLLLGTRTVEGLSTSLQERILSRQDCLEECRVAAKNLETVAEEGSDHKNWNELKVCNLFRLELPLDMVVGSEKFEAAAPADCSEMNDMMMRLQGISRRAPQFTEEAHEERLKKLVDAVRGVEWTNRDVTRMKEAIMSKLTILTDLGELNSSLQDAAYTISCEEARLEDLRRKEEAARIEGEMAASDASLREKMATLEKVIDLLFFSSHTIDQSVDSNVSKRKSNVTVFQAASAMLQCMRDEKNGVVEACRKDALRIHRGMEYEEKAKGGGRGQYWQKIRDNSVHIQALDKKQQDLTAKMERLVREFEETEKELDAVGNERFKAVEAHVELLHSSQQAYTDFIDLERHATSHARNLDKTVQEYEKGTHALQTLEGFLLQEQDFDNFDFSGVAKKLRSMQRRVCTDLNRALNSYETLANELLRRLGAHQKSIEHDLDMASCEVELRKEVLDPMTKKYVVRVRGLNDQRAEVVADSDRLREMVARQKFMCLDKISRYLTEGEVVDVEEQNERDTLRRHEDLMDMRQALIAPREPEIVDERLRIVRQRHTNLSSASTRPPGSASTAGTRPNSKQQSRVKAIRDEVMQCKMLEASFDPVLVDSPGTSQAGTCSVTPADAALSAGSRSNTPQPTDTPVYQYRKQARVIK